MKKLLLTLLLLFSLSGCFEEQTQEYHVTFVSFEGHVHDTAILSEEMTVDQPSDPSRTGYTFVGWYRDIHLLNEYDFDNAVYKDMTLFAKWEENNPTVERQYLMTIYDRMVETGRFQISFEAWLDEIGILVGKPGDKGQITEYRAFNGYLEWRFEGMDLWYEVIDLVTLTGIHQDHQLEWVNGGNYGPSFDSFLEIYPSYPHDEQTWLISIIEDDNPYEEYWYITIDYDNGLPVEIFRIGRGEVLDIPETPEKSGHDFNGWNIGNKPYNFDLPITTNFTLKANWSVTTYTISFYNQNDELIETKEYAYRDLVVYPNTYRTGFVFDAWYDSSERTSLGRVKWMPNEDISVYGNWLKSYTSELNWSLGSEPATMDPGMNVDADGGDLINNLFEGLVREKEGVVYPGIAESWEIINNGYTVRFHIRDDARWSNGYGINADDFVRSWLRAMDPRNGSEYSWIWYYTYIVGADDLARFEGDESEIPGLIGNVGIRSLNDGEILEIDLLKPTPHLVSMLSFWHFMPVPSNSSAFDGGFWTRNTKTMVSNGPFKLESYNAGSGLVLSKNHLYWNKDAVEIDAINVSFDDDVQGTYDDYTEGYYDFLSVLPESEMNNLILYSDEFHRFSLLGTSFLQFNLSGCDVGGTRDIGARDNTVLCNQKLREALALSINREEIMEEMGLGYIPAVGYIPPGILDDQGMDFHDQSDSYARIVENDTRYLLAIQLFNEAATELGMQLTDLRAILNDLEYSFNPHESNELIAVMIQEMWEENLGFSIDLVSVEWQQFILKREQGEFDICRGAWMTDFQSPFGMLEIFTTDYYYNDADYSNNAFDLLITEAVDAPNNLGHYTAMYDAYEILMEDMPIIPVFHYTDTMLVKGYVTGWSRSLLGPIDFSTAYIEIE